MRVNYETIMRFFRDECTPEEKRAVMKWVNESKEHESLFFKWEELFYLGKEESLYNETALKNAEGELMSRLETEGESRKIFPLLKRKWKYVAAIAALITVTGLGIGHILEGEQEKLITVSTGNGETRALVLPDSSKVWLNENSTLHYPETFAGDHRELQLNGEAYFEVTKDKRKPFRVHSQNMDVQVLGTKFNFRSLNGEKTAEASLIEGEVKVEGNHNEGAITLSPGQKVELNLTTRSMKVSQTDAVVDAVWHDNLIPLDQADAFRIAEVLEKLYGVDIILSPDIDRTATYSGVLQKKETIEEVMEILKNAMHIDYKINQGTIFISSGK